MNLPSHLPIRRLPRPAAHDLRSTWRQATAPRIERALRRSQGRSPGGWYVVGASGDLPRGRSLVRIVAGAEIALWRSGDQVLAGPGACPHLGARLDGCVVDAGEILCRWHGLRLPSEWPRGWATFPALDDGVLLWVRPPGQEPPLPAPVPATRPERETSLVTVYTRRARCEPADVVANRLDPWHGAWFHPYAFSHLVVDDDASTDDRLVVDVTFRLNRTWGVPVRAEFTCPDARTIVMRIIDGEGTGSVVETHATPLGRGAGGPVTVITEATLASSARPGFAAARRLGPLLRPLLRLTQARLWVDDAEYAERRYLGREAR